MQRRQVLFGMLGVALTAVAARADVPNQVTLLGQKYAVEHHSRGGAFTNGVTIALQSGGASLQKANLCFVPGADASADRMFVCSPVGTNGDDDSVGDQLYLMTGSDSNGLFGPKTSKATAYFAGNKSHRVDGGRPQTVCWISDAETGAKKDINLAAMFFIDDDRMRFYDFDSLAGGTYASDAVMDFVQGEEGSADATNSDPNMPNGDFEAMAPTSIPGTILMVGQSVADDNGDRVPEFGVFDSLKRKFAPVKTNIVKATASGSIKIDPATDFPNALARIGDTNEYLMLTSQDQGGDDDNTSSETLYRLRVTLPADLTKDAPDSIKVEILGREDILAAGLKPSDGGMFGMAVGREVSPGGPHRVYFCDWHGEIYTLTPAQ
jgi:hypothetical protein